MNNFATRGYWASYQALHPSVRKRADKSFALFRQNPFHPSLHFKKVGKYWSSRIDSGHRALAMRDGEDIIWVWIGSHTAYERLIKGG